MHNLITKLNDAFAGMDAKVLEQTKVWAFDRRQAIKDFKVSEEYKSLRGNSWALYDELYNIAGGKTWYKVLNGNSASNIEAFVIKNCEAIKDKRNASIANKLEKAGVTDVISEEFHQSADGFNGVFKVNTDKGIKTVRISSIYAGGYNIQCLHLRVLVTVK